MSWLLWREFFVNRALVIAGAALLLLPYVFITIFLFWPKDIPWRSADFAGAYTAAAILSYALSQLTITFWGGNAFAGERADRSAEFMAYLPVSKSARLVSKLLLSAIVAGLIWGVNLLVIWMIDGTVQPNEASFNPAYTALFGLITFGVGWGMSSWMSSPALAACAGLAVPLLIAVALSLVAANSEIDSPDFWAMWFTGLGLPVALAGLVFGSWCFVKRVEP